MISKQWPQVQWPYSAAEQKQQQVGAPSNETKNKPVEGYDNPLGYFTFIKHVYNDPNLRIGLFCKPGVKIVAACQINGSSLPMHVLSE
jgi:hypothetical protein